MAEALILDVGHGNAAVFVDGDRALVVDAGSGGSIADTLADQGIQNLDLVVSHQHYDHTSELPALLANPDLRIRKLFLNADPSRNAATRFERDLRASFRDSHARNSTELLTLNATLSPGQFELPTLRIDVLWPSSDMAFGGVGAGTPRGTVVHPHAMAGVLRVDQPDGRSVLLCADVNHTQLTELVKTADLHSTVLVYPHHGGLSGSGDEEAFAHALTTAVGPDVVIFSHGRDTHMNPRTEVVRGVRASRTTPPVRVLCTQLSKNCSPGPIGVTDHLDPDLVHAGARAGASCCGSLRIRLSNDDILVSRGSEHLAFVLDHVEGNVCLATEAAQTSAVAPNYIVKRAWSG
ncbi:MAG: competence protein ComEC [Solirubrobacteraceae bacterium]|jgi:competence protein ComEC|nr:competence protein ComEC [Solirubrobacteraceae bacterium]